MGAARAAVRSRFIYPLGLRRPNNVFLITAFNRVAYFGQDRVSQITRPQYSFGHTTMTGRSANSDALLVRASPK
jgi:hypothetical protein